MLPVPGQGDTGDGTAAAAPTGRDVRRAGTDPPAYGRGGRPGTPYGIFLR